MAWAMFRSVTVNIPYPQPRPSPLRLLGQRVQQLFLLFAELWGGLGEHGFEDRVRIRRRNRLGRLHGGFDGGGVLGFDLMLPRVVPRGLVSEVPANPFDRVTLPPLAFLVLRPIPCRVVRGGVRTEAVRQGLDQRWTAAARGPPHRFGRRPVPGEQVVAVYQDAGHPVAFGLHRDALGGGLAVAPQGNRVVIVLTEEHHGSSIDPCEVHRLVEVSFGRGAIAEVGDGDAVLTPNPGRPSQPDRVEHVGAEGDRGRKDRNVLGWRAPTFVA